MSSRPYVSLLTMFRRKHNFLGPFFYSMIIYFVNILTVCLLFRLLSHKCKIVKDFVIFFIFLFLFFNFHFHKVFFIISKSFSIYRCCHPCYLDISTSIWCTHGVWAGKWEGTMPWRFCLYNQGKYIFLYTPMSAYFLNLSAIQQTYVLITEPIYCQF